MAALLLAQGDTYITGCISPSPALVTVNLCCLANKFMDLVETVFFVLRKKDSQVSFLHLYHHIVVIYYGYMSFIEAPGGLQLIAGSVNCFVHALMYAYYFCSMYDRDMLGKWMDFKRRITQLQLVSVCVCVWLRV